MRIGTIIGLPDAYTQYARIRDENGTAYTVDPGELPKDAKIDKSYAYKLDLWAGDSGLGYELKDP